MAIIKKPSLTINGPFGLYFPSTSGLVLIANQRLVAEIKSSCYVSSDLSLSRYCKHKLRMASSVSAPVVVPQATKRTHAEMSGSEVPGQHSPVKASVEDADVCIATANSNGSESNVNENSTSSKATKISNNILVQKRSEIDATSECIQVEDPEKNVVSKTTVENNDNVDEPSENALLGQANEKNTERNEEASDAVTNNNKTSKLGSEPIETHTAPSSQTVSAQVTSSSSEVPSQIAVVKPYTNNSQLEDGEEPEKKAKLSPSAGSSKTSGKTPEQIFELMDKTFEQRRKIITKQMPTIPELKKQYPDLFMGKQLLIEFQRITKIDIDQKIQEFCVRYATAVIEMARNKKGAAPVLARWEQAKQENETLRQYWDMVTALCLLPLHFGENFVEMVLEIGEDEDVVPQGKIVPTLVARGNIFRTDEFFLIAENTVVQEFEEFTIAFASLYSSYWVFNMMYPKTIENTYNYIQRCIVKQREPGSIPTVCKNFTKALQKWNKGKEGK